MLFVEFLSTAQDILKSSTDRQALINEAADLANEVMKLKADHTKELEKWDMAHATEVSKLSEQMKNLSDTLAEVNKNSKLQHERHAKAVQLAEETLVGHLDEINAIHEHVLGNNFSLHVI